MAEGKNVPVGATEMSTKIYNAYVVERMTVEQLFKHLCEFRKVLERP